MGKKGTKVLSFWHAFGVIEEPLQNGTTLAGIEKSSVTVPKPHTFSELVELGYSRLLSDVPTSVPSPVGSGIS